MSEMTESSGPEPAELVIDGAAQDTQARAAQELSDPPQPDTDTEPGPRPPDRRHQRRWVPVVTSLLAFLLGLAYLMGPMLARARNEYRPESARPRGREVVVVSRHERDFLRR
jgi:hypothetical protein